jgi:serine/threonine-protein kinase
MNVTHQLLEVLAVAHAKGVIHRDLKPANLFMQFSGKLKVLDFGIARVRERALGSEATGTGAVLGTPAFMAPELASAQRDEIDGRSDLWAVGASLFNLLSGEHVHPGEHANQVLIRAATAQARSVLSVCPELPSPVVELLDRALAFEKGARFQSAADMAVAVQRVHERLCGAHRIESVSSLLAAAAALPAPVPRASAPPSAPLSAGGATVSEVRAFGVAASEPPRPARSSSIEPLSLPGPVRARSRRVTSLLGIAAALLGLGLAFDWYVSRATAVPIALRNAAAPRAPASSPKAPEFALQPAPVPLPLPPAPELAHHAPASVATPQPPPAATSRRSTLRRVSAANSEPAAPPARAAKNPLDVELQ